MRRYGIPLAILMFTFALRLHLIGAIALRADEASNLYFAARELPVMVEPLITDDPHPPLYFLILHFWMLLAGQSELAARFPSIFAGVLLVPLVFALGRNIFPIRPNVAVIGAALAAVNPSFVWDSQDVHLYSFFVTTSVASLVTFLRIIRSRTAIAWHVAYIITSAASLYFHYLALFALAVEWVIVLIGYARGRISKQSLVIFLAAQATVAIIFLPWFWNVAPLLTSFKTNFIPEAGVLELFNRTLLAFTVGRADDRLMPPMVEPMIGNIFALGFLALFFLGLMHRSKNRDDREASILVVYLFVPILCFSLFAALRFSIFDERYTLFFAPAFLLIVANGITSLERIRRWLPFGAFLFLLFASCQSLYNYFYVPGFIKSPDWFAFMQIVGREANAGDVVIQNYPDPALPYYLQNRLPRVLLPRSSAQAPEELNADLVRLTNKYQRVWFQAAPGAAWDTEGWVADWLLDHTRKIREYSLRGVRLALYDSEALR